MNRRIILGDRAARIRDSGVRAANIDPRVTLRQD